MAEGAVCVIIAAYNAEKFIARAIKSALAEPDVAEVMVVDDASTDGTAAAARALDDGLGRLKVLLQPRNAGPSAARNRAIAESKAPWLAVLDADDFFLPGRIKGLLAYADKADFVADDMWQVDEANVDGPKKSLLGLTLKGARTVSFEEFVLSNVTHSGRPRGELGFIKPLMRRAFLAEHTIRYLEQMRLGEDYELYTRSLAHGAMMLLIKAQGYVSVVRGNSLSAQHSERDLLYLRDCDRVIARDIALTRTEKQALKQHYLSMDCRLQWRLLILAVKKGDKQAALACFLRPYPVPFYLFKQLALQLYLRTLKKVGL